MRYYKGIKFGWRRARGRGRGTYRMSDAASRARLSSLGRVQRTRTYDQTRRLELDIALASHHKETYRATARRLGCSHVHCWRVTRRYRRGLLRPLPRDKRELIAFRDSLYGEITPSPASVVATEPVPILMPPQYVIPEQYRDLEKWKERYYVEHPWFKTLRKDSDSVSHQ